MLIIPLLMALSFWVLICPPKVVSIQGSGSCKLPNNPEYSSQNSIISDSNVPLQFNEKMKLMKVRFKHLIILYGTVLILHYFNFYFSKGLLKYMIPLTLVYLLEYVINQGLVSDLKTIVFFRFSKL